MIGVGGKFRQCCRGSPADPWRAHAAIPEARREQERGSRSRYSAGAQLPLVPGTTITFGQQSDQFGLPFGPQLGFDPVEMDPDGTDRYIEICGDLLASESEPGAFRDLALSRSEASGGCPVLAPWDAESLQCSARRTSPQQRRKLSICADLLIGLRCRDAAVSCLPSRTNAEFG